MGNFKFKLGDKVLYLGQPALIKKREKRYNSYLEENFNFYNIEYIGMNGACIVDQVKETILEKDQKYIKLFN